jgi:eukaryotic-like serine/threonine-protein kinase
MASNKPAKIGKYDVIDIIGRGGMGVVYKATDPYLDRLVAIKMMTGGYADNPDLLKRFFREAQSTGSLQHPNIVTVYELGDHNGNPYLVMEFLEGESLDTIISTRRPLNLLEKINLMIDVCHGLSYAHRRGIVHRDIKPANIMVLKDGGVKIVDFGIAHIGDKSVTRTGQIMGSLNYMSAEQVNGKPVDARSDIFSTGIVLYQFLTYALPFDGESTASTLLKIIHEPPPSLSNYLTSYPPELETIVLRALAKNREERYSTAEDFALDLGQLQGQLKHDLISRHLSEASLLLEGSELYKAKEQLMQVLKIDRQHTQATQLLREVQQRIQREEIVEQVRQLRREAEEAYRQEQFETAVGHLDRALGLDPQNTEVRSFRESVRADWNRAQKLQNAIKHAELAHHEGDLDSAKHAIEEALELAPNDTHAKALYRAIHRDWVERSRQRQLENYVVEARKEIASRRFTAALDILKQAEALDPSAPQIRALMESAAAAREQEHRRRDLEAVNKEIEEALDRDDYNTACAKADQGLQRFPEERTLLKLKTLAEKQRQLAERKQFIDQQLAHSRKLLDEGRSEELVGVLEAALEKLGSEPRLQSLLLIVRENVKREQFERLKAEYLQKAKDALRRKAFDEAIQILENARGELKEAPEIQDLLQFAKEEAAAAKRREAAEAAADKAHALLSEQEYQQAIRLLESTLREIPDRELEILLAEARHGAEDYNRKLESTIGTAEKLLLNRRAAEALKFLEAQPTSLSKHPAIQKLIRSAGLEAERLRSVDEAIAQSRTLLEQENYDSARRVLDECRRSHGGTPELEQQFADIATRQSAAASHALQKALADGRMLFMATEYGAGVDRLAQVAHLASLVPAQLRSEYDKLYAQTRAGAARQRRAQIEHYIAAGDFTNASELLNRTLTEFPSSREFSGLEDVLRVERARRREAQEAVAAAQSAFRNSDWKQGGESLKKALGLAEQVPALREQVLEAFVKAAEAALNTNWRAAETLLLQLAEVHPKYPQPAGLQVRIAEAKREEFVGQCLVRAQQLRSARDLQGCLREIERGLAGYRDDPQLKSAQRDVQDLIRQEEERARQERARMEREAFLQDALRRSEHEVHLDTRVRILQEALQRYPGDARLERQLSFLQELAIRVAGIVSEAQARERAEKYEASLGQWSILRSIYPQYPTLDDEVARVQQSLERQRAAIRAGWLQKIQSILVTADYERAGGLLRDAQREFPNDRAFSEIEKRLQEGLRVRAKAQKVLADAEKAFSKRQWEKAAETIERACEIAGHDPVIREESLLALLQAAQSLVETDWQTAEMLLDHAAELQPASALLAPVRAKVANSKRNQMVGQYANKASRAQAAGDLQGALQEVGNGLFAYPGDARLLELKSQIEARIQQIAEERRRQQELEKEKARQLEIERQKEAERRQREELEARQRELERKRQEEIQREQARHLEAQHQKELEEERAKALAREQERARELARQQELEREKARQLEIERQKQLERQQKEELEARQRELDRKRQQELEAERARQRAAEQERARQLELQKQREIARQLEEAQAREREEKRARALELERKEKEEKRKQEELKKAQKRAAKDKIQAKRAEEKASTTQARGPTETRIPGASATGIFSSAPPPVDTEAKRARQGAVTQPPLIAPERQAAWQTALARVPVIGHLGTVPVVGIAAALFVIIVWGVWKMLSPTPSTAVAFEITSAPPGALVRIKNPARQCTTPNCRLNLNPGTYELQAELPGYQTTSQTFSVGPSAPHSLAISLSPVPTLPGKPNETGTPKSTPSVSAQLQINGAPSGAQVFLDGSPVGTINRRGRFSSDVPAGNHEIKIVDGKRVSRIISRQFAADSRVDINNSDLQPPSPPTANQPSERDDWQQVKDSGDPEAVQAFLERFPRGAFRQDAESKLESLYWTRAADSNNVAGYREYLSRYPNATHSQSAQAEIAKLDFQAVENSRDTGALEDFMRRYPSGGYHDQVASRLDDLSWQKTSGSDANSLRSYLQKFPGGKHADEANRDIALLTRPLEKPRTPDLPRVQPPAPVFDDRKAVLDVLQEYQKAYEDKNVDELKKIWPEMTPQAFNKLQDVFNTVDSIRLKYEVKGNPEITGDQASVRFLQTLTLNLKGKRQNPMSSTVIMTLKKTNRSPGSPPAWTIDSIR